MSNFFIDRPIFATVLAIVITLAGTIAFLLLPVARFPQITPPSVVVAATFPGADASTIEQSVAAPIETQVNGVPNMIYMDSRSSNDGSYTLNVTFEVGTAQDIAAVDVQNQVAIAQRQLPPDVLRQGVSITKRQPQPLIFAAIEATDPRYDYLFLSNFATLQVYDSLARVPGVGQVLQYGARDYGMRIWLDPGKMSRLGVTTGDISNAINEQNVVAPAGIVGAEPAPPGQQMTYTVTVHGRLRSVEEFENVVLKAGPNGSIVRLRDVARIELAATDYTRSSRLNGRPVALLGVYQLPDANALEVSKNVRATLEQLSHRFPPGIRYTIPLDTSEFVRESIREVEITLFIAASLVLLVVFLFLESWRATLIPMLAVPVSLLGTFTIFVGPRLLDQHADAVRAGSRHRTGGRRCDRGGRGGDGEDGGEGPRSARGHSGRNGGCVEPGDRDRAGAHRRVRAGGLPRRTDGPVLQAIRADAVGVGADLGAHCAHLHAGAVRAAL